MVTSVRRAAAVIASAVVVVALYHSTATSPGTVTLAEAATVIEECQAHASTPKEERYKQMMGNAMRVENEIVALRRELHRRPALMYEEYEAQALVIETLNELGISSKKTAITGVVADLGASEGTNRQIVVLRADMDALPIHEEAEIDFRSEIDGVMHACGHDTHTAMLLGAAKLLKPFEERLASAGKTVRFAFQPSEEGGAGGKMMIDEGLLKGASASFALHTSSRDPTGLIIGKYGRTHAAAGFFTFVIRGKGGHAASPHTAIDPVNTAAQVVLSLNTIVGRMVDNPNSPVRTWSRRSFPIPRAVMELQQQSLTCMEFVSHIRFCALSLSVSRENTTGGDWRVEHSRRRRQQHHPRRGEDRRHHSHNVDGYDEENPGHHARPRGWHRGCERLLGQREFSRGACDSL